MDPNEQAILDLIAGSKKLGVELTPEQANYILTEVKEFQKPLTIEVDFSPIDRKFFISSLIMTESYNPRNPMKGIET